MSVGWSKARLSMFVRGAVLLLCVLVILFPIAWLLLMSLKTHRDALSYPPTFVFIPTFQHYGELLRETQFFRALMNSTLIGVGAVLISLAVGTPAAYVLSKGKLRLEQGALKSLLVLRMMPRIVFIVPFFIMLRQIGLIDSHLGLILTYQTFTIPFFIWTLRPFFEAIPASLEEAAHIDGATNFEALRFVLLPLIRPGLVTTSILAFILCWNEFLWALILSRRNAVTAPVAIVNFMAFEGTEWGKIAAGGVLVLLPALVFSLIARRFLTSGIMGGAVKG